MPWESKKQARWGHGRGGKKAGFSKEKIEEWDEKTDFGDLPEEAQAGKGPTRRQGSGQKEPESSKIVKRMGREIHKNAKRGGFHTSDKGYTRKAKHKGKSDETIGEELTPMDETYRGVGFPMAQTLTWATPIRGTQAEEDDDETPVIDTPGFPPTKEGGGDVPDKGAAWGSSVAADLTWSTHKSETFDDTGEKGEHPAWGLKSIIDRGVKPHEKSDGAKRIEDAENNTQKRTVPNKSFKSYSMVGAFYW